MMHEMPGEDSAAEPATIAAMNMEASAAELEASPDFLLRLRRTVGNRIGPTDRRRGPIAAAPEGGFRSPPVNPAVPRVLPSDVAGGL